MPSFALSIEHLRTICIIVRISLPIWVKGGESDSRFPHTAPQSHLKFSCMGGESRSQGVDDAPVRDALGGFALVVMIGACLAVRVCGRRSALCV